MLPFHVVGYICEVGAAGRCASMSQSPHHTQSFTLAIYHRMYDDDRRLYHPSITALLVRSAEISRRRSVCPGRPELARPVRTFYVNLCNYNHFYNNYNSYYHQRWLASFSRTDENACRCARAPLQPPSHPVGRVRVPLQSHANVANGRRLTRRSLCVRVC